MSTDRMKRQAASGVIAAVAGVTVVWLIARAFGDDLRANTFQGDNKRISLFLAAGSALVYGAIGAVFGGWLARSGKPRHWWYIAVAAILILAGLFAFASTESNATALWLNIMHLVGAAAIVPTIARILPAKT